MSLNIICSSTYTYLSTFNLQKNQQTILSIYNEYGYERELIRITYEGQSLSFDMHPWTAELNPFISKMKPISFHRHVASILTVDEYSWQLVSKWLEYDDNRWVDCSPETFVWQLKAESSSQRTHEAGMYTYIYECTT